MLVQYREHSPLGRVGSDLSSRQGLGGVLGLFLEEMGALAVRLLGSAGPRRTGQGKGTPVPAASGGRAARWQLSHFPWGADLPQAGARVHFSPPWVKIKITVSESEMHSALILWRKPRPSMKGLAQSLKVGQQETLRVLPLPAQSCFPPAAPPHGAVFGGAHLRMPVSRAA